MENENTVGAGKGLDQPVHFQVFIHPQGVERGGVKACKEHIDHDEQVQLLIFHPQGYILVVALKFIPVRGIIGMEQGIVILNGAVQKIPRGLIQRAGILAVFLVQNICRSDRCRA